MVLKIRLRELLDAQGMTQKELAEKTGLRPNTISEMVKNTRDSLNRHHVGIVAKALDITDLNQLLYLES